MSAIVSFILAIGTVPLFAVMVISAIVMSTTAGEDGAPLASIMISIHGLASMKLLEALPLFAFGGYLLAYSNAPNRLVRLSNALLGWLPGGLAIVAIVGCTFLTALTGASGVTIVALGGLLLPALLKQGYPENFSLGTITAGGSLGVLFAPSLPIILYGVIAETSPDHLFRAGLIPGMMIIIALSIYAAFCGNRAQVPKQKFVWKELRSACWEAKWEIPLPIIIIYAIYGGQIIVSEAAVIAVTYIVIVEVLIQRDIKFRKIGAIARESMVLIGGILIILGSTLAVNNAIVDAEIPTRIFDAISPYMKSPIAFLICLNIFLLVVGCMIDIYAAIVLIVPLILPIAARFGIDPVHLGIIFLTNLGIGYATPPVGMNLFIASVRFDKPILKLYWACIPFILILLVMLFVITYFPQLSLFLVPKGDGIEMLE
jgi:C4-dicarboxylate transporter DctM subunit